MQGERDDEGSCPVGAGGKGKAPAPPPPPPSRETINGGHRWGLRGRRRRRPVREVFAVGFMVAGAAYFLLADALAVADPDVPSAEWFFAAFLLWIAGLNLLAYLMS